MEMITQPQQASLVYCPHPILTTAGRKVVYAEPLPGEPISAYLDRLGINLSHTPVILAMDGEVIARELWPFTYPQRRSIITVRAVVQGGGGGSNPIRTIAMLAIMYWSGGTAGAWVGSALGTSAAVGGAIFAMAGMALVNSLLPPPMPELGRAGGMGANPSPTYSLSGARNRARQFEPLPLLFGTHRLWPDLGVQPYTEFVGDDQYLYMVFNFGITSHLQLGEFQIGDTPLSKYTDVETWTSGPDGSVPNFPGNVDSDAVGTTLTSAAGWITRTTSLDATQIAVDLAGSLFYVGDAGITSRAAAFEVEYRKAGTSTWLPAVHSTVEEQYTHYWSAGQTVTDGDGNYWWQQIAYGNNDPAQHVEGAAYDTSNTWHWRPYTERCHNNGLGGTVCDAAPPQTYTVQVAQAVITNASRKPVRRTFRWSVAKGQYEVRVRRVTADETDEKAVSDFAWTQLRTYQPDTADYTGQTRVGVKIRASGQLNGVIDEFNAIGTAWVPAWNGSAWATVPTSNPAWAFLEMARGKTDSSGKLIYGGGLADSRIDIAAIKEWATWCTLHGLNFDGVFDRRMTVQDALAIIAQCGRAAPTWSSGVLGVVWDAENLPVKAVFGMPNIKAGSFSVEYVSESLADEIVVKFINPALGYQPDRVRVTVPGVTSVQRPQEIELFGCARKVMAGKFGNLYAAKQAYHRRRMIWESDIEGLTVDRGDVVLLSHDLTQWGYSGRLVAGTTGVLTLDRAVPFTSGQTHYVMVRHPNGTQETHAVDYVAGESDTLTLTSTTLSAAPDADIPVDWLWLFAPQATPGKKVKVISVKPMNEHVVQISAIDEVDEYYAAETGTYTYVQPQQMTELLPVVSDLQCNEDMLDLTGLTRVHITWTLRNANGAALRLSINGQPFENVGVINGNSYSLDLVGGQTLSIEVRPVALVNLSNIATQTLAYTVQGLSAAPSDITGFVVTRKKDYLRFSWYPVSDIDIKHYQIRRGDSWSGSVLVGTPTSAPFEVMSAQAGTYLIKAIDMGGRESVNATSVVISSVAEINVVVTHSEAAAGWNGVITNLRKTAAGISLLPTKPIAAFTNPINSYTMSILRESEIVTSGDYVTETIDLLALLTSRIDIAPVVEQVGPASSTAFVSATFKIDTSADGVSWDGYREFIPGDYSAMAVRFQITLATKDRAYDCLLSAFDVVVDVPDREITFIDEPIPVGGKRLVFSPPFNAIPLIDYSLQDGAIGDTISFTNRTLDGVDVAIYDSTKTIKAGNADISARGY